MRFLLATNNPHKKREFLSLLPSSEAMEFILPQETGLSVTFPEETGTTFEQNAKLKADSLFKQTGLPTLADDSGLVVPILGGAPGVYSARYAGEEATDAENRSKLALTLQDKNLQSTPAYFCCVIACLLEEGTWLIAEGRCEGSVHIDEKGDAEFGYDKLFSPLNSSKRFAEMPLEEKNLYSHRQHAFQAFRKQLKELDGQLSH